MGVWVFSSFNRVEFENGSRGWVRFQSEQIVDLKARSRVGLSLNGS